MGARTRAPAFHLQLIPPKPLTKRIRERIASDIETHLREVDRLIARLDAADVDCDLEDSEASSGCVDATGRYMFSGNLAEDPRHANEDSEDEEQGVPEFVA
jgi:hypothetical protein